MALGTRRQVNNFWFSFPSILSSPRFLIYSNLIFNLAENVILFFFIFWETAENRNFQLNEKHIPLSHDKIFK